MSTPFLAVMQQRIEEKLTAVFSPEYMDVINESYQHSVPVGSESHFKVVIVSEAFAGSRLVGRHRQVYSALADELVDGVHALALHTFTPEEWAQRDSAVNSSPACHGGGS